MGFSAISSSAQKSTLAEFFFGGGVFCKIGYNAGRALRQVRRICGKSERKNENVYVGFSGFHCCRPDACFDGRASGRGERPPCPVATAKQPANRATGAGSCAPSLEYIRVKMGKSIFLDPPENDEPKVYVRIRDTSGHGFQLQRKVLQLLKKTALAVRVV